MRVVFSDVKIKLRKWKCTHIKCKLAPFCSVLRYISWIDPINHVEWPAFCELGDRQVGAIYASVIQQKTVDKIYICALNLRFHDKSSLLMEKKHSNNEEKYFIMIMGQL